MKLIVEKLKGEHVSLRAIQLDDCQERYVSWLNDPEVNRYLETRWSVQSLESVRSYVEKMISDPFNYLFAILENGTGLHVGNIKIGPIEPHHKFASISYFVGERAAWGKGYATEAIRLVTRFGFERLGLHSIQAGIYENNLGSARALKKAGFVFEGGLRKQMRTEDGWEDHLFFSTVLDLAPTKGKSK